jgi:hypothetical protein
MGGLEGSIYSRRRFVPVTTISAPRLPQREQTNRSRQSITVVFATVPSRHLRGIGFDLMAAIPAPDNEANVGGSRAA